MTKKNRKNKRKHRDGEIDGTPTIEGTEASRPERRASTGYDKWRENLEAIIVAFILALIIRHFSIEAFEIPTGSMAPTLYGIHSWSQCPNCDTEFNMSLSVSSETQDIIAKYELREVYEGACPDCGAPHIADLRSNREDDLQCRNGECDNHWEPERSLVTKKEILVGANNHNRFRCPLCEYNYEGILTRNNQYGGHKILVNKFEYWFREPRRWDVIVFHYDESKNYIKRLLGLPGETVKILGGDLYVRAPGETKFKIARKIDRPDARQSLWFLIADSSIKEKGYNTTTQWLEVFEGRSEIKKEITSKWWTWNAKELRYSVNVVKPSGRIACLRYNRKCDDYYSYNTLRRGLSGGKEVGDKKVAFTVRPSSITSAAIAGKNAWIGGEICDGEFTFQFRIPIGGSGAEAAKAVLWRMPTDDNQIRPSPTRDRTAVLDTAQVALALRKKARIEFENVDDRVAVKLNGEEILVSEYVSNSTPVFRGKHSLLLLAEGVSADFDKIRVYRDIYYTDAAGNGRDAVRPEGLSIQPNSVGSEKEYFPCGDNSPSSLDGRMFGTVPKRNMMGRAFAVFWPAIPWHVERNWQWKLIH